MIARKIVGFSYLHIYSYLGELPKEYYKGFVLIEMRVQKRIDKV